MKQYSLKNPFTEKNSSSLFTEKETETPSRYQDMLERGEELLELPKKGGGESRVRTQHDKGRMTVWERIKVLTDKDPHITFQNWGA